LTSRRLVLALPEPLDKVRPIFATRFPAGLLTLSLALAETVTTLAEANKITLAQLRAVVTKHLDKNGRRWVSMSALFSFVKI